MSNVYRSQFLSEATVGEMPKLSTAIMGRLPGSCTQTNSPWLQMLSGPISYLRPFLSGCASANNLTQSRLVEQYSYLKDCDLVDFQSPQFHFLSFYHE